MILADFCAHCLSLPAVEETTPFGPEVLGYKVLLGNTFATAVPDEHPHRVNLKCDPELSWRWTAGSLRATSSPAIT